MVKIVRRPWGKFNQFALNKKCTVKIIEVFPRQELSLQVHKHREEEWYFITSGVAQIGNKKRKIKKGGIVYVKKNTPHRLIAGKREVVILEISFGNFKESDEIRLEDKYER